MCLIFRIGIFQDKYTVRIKVELIFHVKVNIETSKYVNNIGKISIYVPLSRVGLQLRFFHNE